MAALGALGIRWFAVWSDEPLPPAHVAHSVCAFPSLDFQDLKIGMTEGRVRKQFGDSRRFPITSGCVAYRYEPYLFNEGSPTLYLILRLEGGELREKWLEPLTPEWDKCRGGIAHIVDVGDLFYKDVRAEE